ncbi:MAG: hypothetical protein NVS3B1_17730 [Marmoricola sp.]
MIVIVSESSQWEDHGSVIVVTGTSEDGAKEIRFGGDHRPMRGLYEAVQAEGEIFAEIEPWQVSGVTPIAAPA